VKPPPFSYAVPGSLEEAVDILRSDEDAKVLAGGQSLVPMLSLRLSRPSVLVDIGRLRELDTIAVSNGSVHVGAMVRQRRAEQSAELTESCPLVGEALKLVGHPQIRNRGTVGGSLAHADPAAELGAIALVLDAVVHTFGRGGGRVIPIAEFFLAHYTTSLLPDEILTMVEFARQPEGAGWACTELARRPGDFPICGAAAQLVVDGAGEVSDVRIALFGVGPTPLRAVEAEAVLRGQACEDEALRSAAGAAVVPLAPPADMHASSELRRHLAEIITYRTLKEAVSRTPSP
jgi:carbon-monoxide dehydrogenase medium subunit